MIVPLALGTAARAVPPSARKADGPAPVSTSASGQSGAQSSSSPSPVPHQPPADLDERLRRLEKMSAAVLEQNRKLVEQNHQLAEQNQGLARALREVNRRHDALARRLDRIDASSAPSALAGPGRGPGPGAPGRADDFVRASAGLVTPAPDVSPPSGGPEADAELADAPGAGDTEAAGPRWMWPGSEFLVGSYDRETSQFVLVKPRDAERTPFELNFDLITQLRFTGFSRSAQTWTNSAGTVLPVQNYDMVEVNRNWFQFSGYALDPRLHYMAVIFGTSTTNTNLFLGWIDYRFSKAFVLSAGYYKVPGSREWYDSFRYTLGADRTMATTFFRPNMSPGIWASGEPFTDFHYVAMYANSFNGVNQVGNRLGHSSAFGATVWWEPLGKFGPGPSDVEDHRQLAVRVGTSATFSREELGGAAAQSNPENTLFRLSNGTPLSTIGALAPGVQVTRTSDQLWAIDAALKYRGFSFSGEYYFRWLDNFRTLGGPLAVRGLFTHGAYGQTSYFLVPKRLEAYARFSYVNGMQGGGNEWGGGINWYVLARRNWRMTFDVARINNSPADNILTGYRAGESGTLFQLQMLTDF